MVSWRSRRAAVLCSLIIGLFAMWIGGNAAVAAASESPAPSSTTASKVVLRIGWPREADNLNPFIGWENSSFEIWALQYDFLFGFGANEQPTLDLAAEFPTKENGGISPDGKVWTIKIRQGVKWQDGQPLTAEDVAFTYNYNIENELYAFGIMTIGIDHVEVVDPYTVKIVCTRPKADMERLWLPILPKHIWSKVEPQDSSRARIRTSPRSSAVAPSRSSSSRRAATPRLVKNPDLLGQGSRRWTRSSSSPTRTRTR